MASDQPYSRVKFHKGEQKKFLAQTIFVLDIEYPKLATISNISDRTLRDWRREKNTMSLDSLKTICNHREMVFPENIKILPEHWQLKEARSLGGRRYVEFYGAPGTLESRKRGGLVVWKKLRSNLEFVKKSGFITRKRIKRPKRSPLLAEFVGIMLGDGGVRNTHQITISFNPKKENKIVNQIDIPRWVWNSEKYQIACLRGLMDSDGGFYHHKYCINRKKYIYLKMCFTSYSRPLLKSVTTILENLGLSPKNTANNRVYLYSLTKIHKYVEKVGTSNPRYLNFFNNFITKYK